MDAEALDPQLIGTSVAHVPMDRLRPIFDGMFEGVWLVAANGRTTYANGAMARLLGSTPEEMRGHPITDYLDDGPWTDVDGIPVRQRIHAGEAMGLRLRRVDGSFMFGVVAGSPITTDDGIFVGTMLNVSDVAGKRSIDAQMVQNQRMEVVGQFAGGIAHDFNNLLTAIQGYAELARAALPDDDPICKDLDQVLAGARRAAAITHRLLAFTRRQTLSPVEVDPAQVIADLVPMLKPLLGDDIDVVLDIRAGHGWVRVDPAELEQVIVNLAVNARDAMPAGGTLTVAVQDLGSADADQADRDGTPGRAVRISVSDMGSGMDEATMARIFDPFYTTKGPGKGTGLGLSTVFAIVAQSGGHIQVETAVGEGSTFHVDLPRLPTPVPAGPPDSKAATRRRSGVVLLVEDDDAVQGFARRVLEAAGYSVLVAANASQALQASQRWGEAIDVLVTDVVMPGIHGPELAAQIRAQRPGVGVVLMSGNADDDLTRAPGLEGSCESLPKPFDAEALNRAVGRAADRARRATRR